jgi:hypothetical protein
MVMAVSMNNNVIRYLYQPALITTNLMFKKKDMRIAEHADNLLHKGATDILTQLHMVYCHSKINFSFNIFFHCFFR